MSERAELTAAALERFGKGERSEAIAEIDRQLAAGVGPIGWQVLIGLLRRDLFAEEVREASLLARSDPDRWGCWPGDGDVQSG